MKLFGNMQGITPEQLQSALTTVREHYAALAERLERLEKRAASDHLLVLEAAEKVATRLKDRERKRRAPRHDDDDDDDDQDALPLDPFLAMRER